jgi:hypothetical protein
MITSLNLEITCSFTANLQKNVGITSAQDGISMLQAHILNALISFVFNGRTPSLYTTRAFFKDVIKAIGNNEERKRNHSTETQDFNVENPLQQREVKTTGTNQQNFTISGVFTKRRG